MRVILKLILLTSIVFLLFSCSNDSSEQTTEETADRTEMSSSESSIEEELAIEPKQENTNQTKEEIAPEQDTEVPDGANADRKIIYHANVEIEVTNFHSAIEQLEQQTLDTGGYIVTSNTYQAENDVQEGSITARIPQAQFESFMDSMENGEWNMIQKNISGEDVTEQYVDLESRLKSKQVVEERLLAFMEQAEKTEDLLEISNDLADVQEQIEQITGQMNYLKNKSDLATVTINVREHRVDIIQDEDLNTWQKTTEQLKKSMNFLLKSSSGLIVFFIGNLPVLALIAIIASVGYYIWRRKKQTSNK